MLQHPMRLSVNLCDEAASLVFVRQQADQACSDVHHVHLSCLTVQHLPFMIHWASLEWDVAIRYMQWANMAGRKAVPTPQSMMNKQVMNSMQQSPEPLMHPPCTAYLSIYHIAARKIERHRDRANETCISKKPRWWSVVASFYEEATDPAKSCQLLSWKTIWNWYL